MSQFAEFVAELIRWNTAEAHKDCDRVNCEWCCQCKYFQDVLSAQERAIVVRTVMKRGWDRWWTSQSL